MKTPDSIKAHSADYKNGSFAEYSFEELGHWIHLLMKRATHRANLEKAEKDMYDAQNYLDIMQEKLTYQRLNPQEGTILHDDERG